MRVQSMQSIDEMIASFVDFLENCGELDNTYIFFTSDNGYHMGQHRQPPGKDLPYEEDIRVPLIVRGPGIPPGRLIPEYLVCNVDFAPTVAELAGLIPPNFVDGRSFVSLMGSQKTSTDRWRKVVPLEFYPHKVSEGNDPTIPSYLGARASNFLFTEYSDGFREYYNLEQDPDQLHNLVNEMDMSELEVLSTWLKEFHQSEGEALRNLEESFPSI
jgi:arylsulfatase A-like enzyme